MIKEDLFAKIPGGKNIYQYTLTNKNGLSVKAINYGCALTSFFVPANDGKIKDILLGYDNIEPYVKQDEYIGVIIGRHANRISGASFSLGDKTYTLHKNDGNNHLHGGLSGFDKKVWNSYIKNGSVAFEYLSADGEENYPGNMTVKVTYSLSDSNEFIIKYEAKTDKLTPCNLTNHAYFNLAGHNSGSIEGQFISINADNFTPANREMIPLGEILPEDNTPMDLRKPVKIQTGLCSDFEQIKNAGGYDCNWVLNKNNGDLSLAASAFCEETGIKMEVYTTQPCLQFYTGNSLKGKFKGKEGANYSKQTGFCLETQMYPDSLNNGFPKALLDVSEAYEHTTVFKVNS